MTSRTAVGVVMILAVVVVHAGSAEAQIRVDKSRQRDAVEHFRAGQKLVSTEQFERAIQEFSAAVKLDPMLALAHYELGQANMKLKQYPQAIDAFVGCRQAFQDLQSLADRDRADADRLREDEIREMQDTIARIRSGQIKVGGQPLITQLEGKITELERMKMVGLKGSQTPPAVSLALGSAYFRSGQLADAEREYSAAIKVFPGFGEAHNNLAVVYLMTNRIADAERETALAEKSGYNVAQGLKDDIKRKKGGGGPGIR